MSVRPVMLCVLDGWGHRDSSENNAVALAETPVFDRLWRDCPTGFLDASAEAVGLPDGQMGNSEVGHTNLGAGRVVLQDLPRIDAAIAEGGLPHMPELVAFAEQLKASGGTCHLMGLLSPGGVHAHQDQIAALATAVSGLGVTVVIHAFLDGRDTPPKAAEADMARFLSDLGDAGRIGTVIGRFFALDRDNRWDRVARAYAALVQADGLTAPDPATAIADAYKRGETDEFVEPTVIAGYDGMKDGDGILMTHFRADRAREILTALVEPDFDGFTRAATCQFAALLGMVEYSSALSKRFSALFPTIELHNTLGEICAKAGRRQLRIAETEKYPHVTFFLNGGREDVFEGEDRILVPSPRVKTYDLKPEMSAEEVTDKLVEAIGSGTYDLIVANFANPDMVGHTGVLTASIQAIETVDHCLGRIERALVDAGGTMFLTADHGNCETMVDPVNGGPHTAHTTNLVPAVLVNGPADVTRLAQGRLADVAPTLLRLMEMEQPTEMTGHSLLRLATETGREPRAALGD
ncbi:MAG: 2,3-bisphosphoglycerate-independent phosphoglycerate mutase [Rhodospirillaceae bacterium]|nr:2,3-bisphosphoglycerate-independent phosphoglycerate mutase [Rhodospirillaceae bacterium]